MAAGGKAERGARRARGAEGAWGESASVHLVTQTSPARGGRVRPHVQQQGWSGARRMLSCTRRVRRRLADTSAGLRGRGRRGRTKAVRMQAGAQAALSMRREDARHVTAERRLRRPHWAAPGRPQARLGRRHPPPPPRQTRSSCPRMAPACNGGNVSNGCNGHSGMAAVTL